MPNGVPMSWLRTSYDHPPLWVDRAEGSRFRDLDGHEYADFNIADMSMFAGYGPEPVVEAVARRVADGSQFLLPSEDSIWVAEELGRRYGLPKWQFTLQRDPREPRGDPGGARRDRTRTRALLRREVPRPLRRGARHPRGRPAGRRGSRAAERRDREGRRRAVQRPRGAHVGARVPRDRARDDRAGPHQRDRAADARSRVPRGAAGRDPRGGHAALLRRDAHAGRRAGRAHARCGTLEPDIVSIGQVDRRRRAARRLRHDRRGRRDARAPVPPDEPEKPLVATGGTLFGNPLSMAAARATMGDVLTPEAYAHTQALGARLADGIEAAIDRDAGFPGPRTASGRASGCTFAPAMARNADEALDDASTCRCGGSCASTSRTEASGRRSWVPGRRARCRPTQDDVDAYVGAFGELVEELTS